MLQLTVYRQVASVSCGAVMPVMRLNLTMISILAVLSLLWDDYSKWHFPLEHGDTLVALDRAALSMQYCFASVHHARSLFDMDVFTLPVWRYVSIWCAYVCVYLTSPFPRTSFQTFDLLAFVQVRRCASDRSRSVDWFDLPFARFWHTFPI